MLGKHPEHCLNIDGSRDICCFLTYAAGEIDLVYIYHPR